MFFGMAQYIPARARTVRNNWSNLFMGESPARKTPRVAEYMPDCAPRKPVDKFYFWPPNRTVRAGAQPALPAAELQFIILSSSPLAGALLLSLVQIRERGMVPIFCPLRFVQGFRCSRCPWVRLLPDCHTAWAVPVCEVDSCCRDFELHSCRVNAQQTEPFVLLQ